jgi:hypothetical protein
MGLNAGAPAMAREAMKEDTSGQIASEDESTTESVVSRVRPSEQVGRYRVIQKIEGGMGEVYHAEQAKPVRRKVALKIITRGMDTWTREIRAIQYHNAMIRQ